MIIALLLLGYAFLLALFVPSRLLGATWVDRAPRLAIATWQFLCAAVLVSIFMAGLALLIPTTHVSSYLSQFLRACAMALREQYASPGGVVIGVAGAVVVLAVIGRVGWYLVLGFRRTIRVRTAHQEILDLVGTSDEGRGIVVLDSDEPTVYCLPGRRSRTVVTTAALNSLDRSQLDAVLAHERAHLAERHDLAVGFANALASAFSVLKVFAIAASEIARLVELRADDIAAAQTDRLTVAEALLTVGSHANGQVLPALALVSKNNAAARIRRLIPPSNPLGWRQSAVGSFVIAVLISLPFLLLGGPALAAASQDFCPLTTISADS